MHTHHMRPHGDGAVGSTIDATMCKLVTVCGASNLPQLFKTMQAADNVSQHASI